MGGRVKVWKARGTETPLSASVEKIVSVDKTIKKNQSAVIGQGVFFLEKEIKQSSSNHQMQQIFGFFTLV
jgi:hypothetical protein